MQAKPRRKQFKQKKESASQRPFPGRDALFSVLRIHRIDYTLEQIKKKQYAATLQQAGVKEIVKTAITFDGKRVWIAKQ